MPRRSPRPGPDYLSSRIQLGMKFGLATMRALVAELGHPERTFATLLVAGTNGKGSVVAYADSVLRASGLRVGRYTSPHLVHLNERIVTGGRAISDRALDEAVGSVRRAAETLARSRRLPSEPTFFEVVTAAAFVHFAQARIDVAVLEVGMGARLDATNVADPLASAIVTIDRDHEAYLGTTLAAIAREKAGVLRRGRVTVLGPLAAEARRAIEGRARRAGARLADSARDTTVAPEAKGGGLRIETPHGVYRNLQPLPGGHQRANVAVAIRLLEEAGASGLAVDLGRLPAAVARTRWPGRLQRLPGRPPLIVDGAHNPAAARALAEELRKQKPFVLVFAAMADKDIAEMGRVLLPLAREIVLTRVPGDRAASPAEIARRVKPLAARAYRTRTVGAALARARQLAGPRGLVVAAGSLYLAGEVLRSVAGGRRGSRPRK
ncbi:MAG TPA: folylpolyglutamate synthase/dihydrofolate synthase family protein [Vicinamibacteria bacterium]|nr:folylpolyglutamate synthase/dihydrofolate synthase family protein [Vicinamibacteria bacterium]